MLKRSLYLKKECILRNCERDEGKKRCLELTCGTSAQAVARPPRERPLSANFFPASISAHMRWRAVVPSFDFTLWVSLIRRYEAEERIQDHPSMPSTRTTQPSIYRQHTRQQTCSRNIRSVARSTILEALSG
ncbi:unnamed protein product [Mortierella alpina]